MKKAIITGSTGFIGSEFVEFLVSNGIDVLAIGRKDLNDISKIRRNRIKDATYLNLDMKNITNLKAKYLKSNGVLEMIVYFLILHGVVKLIFLI